MTSRSPEGEALTELILEIFQINGELLDAGNQITAPHGLTSARWQVMGAIDLEGQPLTVSQIARRMGLARQGVQRLINELSKSGIVVANPNIDHKRAPLFSLSTKGRKIMDEINIAQAEWVNALASGKTTSSLEETTEMLRAIKGQLQNSKEKKGHK